MKLLVGVAVAVAVGATVGSMLMVRLTEVVIRLQELSL